MSAFGAKADMAFCGISLSRSLLGVKRTWLVAAQMSAFDPKRTLNLKTIGGILMQGAMAFFRHIVCPQIPIRE
jgi:hypothetical protein